MHRQLDASSCASTVANDVKEISSVDLGNGFFGSVTFINRFTERQLCLTYLSLLFGDAWLRVFYSTSKPAFSIS